MTGRAKASPPTVAAMRAVPSRNCEGHRLRRYLRRDPAFAVNPLRGLKIKANGDRKGGRLLLLGELITAIDGYIAHHNIQPKPFIWTKSARDILQKVIRANSRSSSKQNAALH